MTASSFFKLARLLKDSGTWLIPVCRVGSIQVCNERVTSGLEAKAESNPDRHLASSKTTQGYDQVPKTVLSQQQGCTTLQREPAPLTHLSLFGQLARVVWASLLRIQLLPCRWLFVFSFLLAAPLPRWLGYPGEEVEGYLHHQALRGRRVPERGEQLGVSQRHREFVLPAVLHYHSAATATSPATTATTVQGALALSQGNEGKVLRALVLHIVLRGLWAWECLRGGRGPAPVLLPLAGRGRRWLGLSAASSTGPPFRLHLGLVFGRLVLGAVRSKSRLALYLQAGPRVCRGRGLDRFFGLFGSNGLPLQWLLLGRGLLTAPLARLGDFGRDPGGFAWTFGGRIFGF